MRSWLDRQTFLGLDSDNILARSTVGFVGLGGGGSHCVQQAAHLGLGNFILVDPDIIEDKNRNRLIGGTVEDVKNNTPKVDISERMIMGINPDAKTIKRQMKWQLASDTLKHCDVIIGCLDAIRDKDELERFSRRFLIPYIDIGMDVYKTKGGFLISGQAILSCPTAPCLRCFGIVTDEALKEEAKNYGVAGGNPQVVWPNGVLASSAIGLLLQLLTPWHDNPIISAYLEYDGNLNTMRESQKFKILQNHICQHHPETETGDPGFDIGRLV